LSSTNVRPSSSIYRIPDIPEYTHHSRAAFSPTLATAVSTSSNVARRESKPVSSNSRKPPVTTVSSSARKPAPTVSSSARKPVSTTVSSSARKPVTTVSSSARKPASSVSSSARKPVSTFVSSSARKPVTTVSSSGRKPVTTVSSSGRKPVTTVSSSARGAGACKSPQRDVHVYKSADYSMRSSRRAGGDSIKPTTPVPTLVGRGSSRVFQSSGQSSSTSRSVLHYTAPGGGIVRISRIVKPHKELGISLSASPEEIKAAFRRCATSPRRQERVMASLSYHMLTSTDRHGRCQRYKISEGGRCYEITHTADIYMLAACGHTTKLLEKVSQDKNLLDSTDECGRTVLYLSARCGFYDTTKALLKRGASVNKPQSLGSTALHGASYYGQGIIVTLLLGYGADPTVKNKFSHIPEDETPSDEIRAIFEKHKTDPIASITSSLFADKLTVGVHLIEHRGAVVAKEIQRNVETLDAQTRQQWNHILSHWESVWHGTKFKYIGSILRNGLMASGTRLPSGDLIKPPAGHFQLGRDYFGFKNWARAIFLSPSVLYASHVVYSERVVSEKKQWCVLVRARVAPSSYTTHDPTTLFTAMDGEPENSEFRVPVSSDHDSILRVESSRNVVVTSIVFIELDFLEHVGDSGLTFQELQAILH